MNRIEAIGMCAVALAAFLAPCRGWGQTPIPPPPGDFAAAAAQSDEYEILAGRDTVTQSRNARIKTFAQQMIEDHTRMSGSVRQAAAASGLPEPPPAMNGQQAMMLSALQSLRGPEFDRTYAKQQVLAHHEAFAVAQSYARSGADENLKKAAQARCP